MATALCLAACAGGGSGTSPRVRPSGPPRVQAEVVAAHGEQFDEELPERPAGSQQEGAAATYLLGHLQQAGYAARLDAVPVANLVRSTNVIGVPPEEASPSVVVVAAYDTPRAGSEPSGTTLGLFLELARALEVADPEHMVEFVGLGAEHAPVGGGNLGSRRLAAMLLDEGLEPFVIVLEPGPAGKGPNVRGSRSGEFSGAGDAELLAGDDTARVFRAAGFGAAAVSGDPQAAGDALLEFLAREASG